MASHGEEKCRQRSHQECRRQGECLPKIDAVFTPRAATFRSGPGWDAQAVFRRSSGGASRPRRWIARINEANEAEERRATIRPASAYPLTAVDGGDTSNAGSTSTVVSQVVNRATSSPTLTSFPNPSRSGQAVAFTAPITSPTAKPTSDLRRWKTVLGTAQLSAGNAQFTTSTLAVGSTKVTATYSGDSNIATSSACRPCSNSVE